MGDQPKDDAVMPGEKFLRGTIDLLGERWIDTPPGLCTHSIDLDPFATYDGGLNATCELPEGHEGPHTRTIVWTQEHPDAD